MADRTAPLVPDRAVPGSASAIAAPAAWASLPAEPGQPGPVWLRLALAFVAVALAAVALLAGLTAAFAAADVSRLVTQQRQGLTDALAVAAGGAWTRTGGWDRPDLVPVLKLAARVGAQVQVRDRSGRQVDATNGFAASAGKPQLPAHAIIVGGERVGQVVVRFTGTGLGRADQALQTALLQAIAGAAGLAAVVALLTGLAVARRITRPVERLIEVTRAMGHGDRAARVGPIRAPGELSELAGAFDQMAGTLGREEQLRRDLVADVAHELRTPIAVLQAGHEALLDGITEPTPAQLASLRDEVLRLARIVGDLQTLAQAEAAALHLELTQADLAQIAAVTADSLAGRFEAAGITVQRQLSPVQVRADPGRLHQVIANLLTNALKFTPAGGQVTIATAAADGLAELEVTDTGAGIDPDELPRIFDRFWRGRKAARISGSGIGLAVAAELARAHGGDLTAASAAGEGTRMTLTVPRGPDRAAGR
jgi:two-component system, OmpR family, sensor histidine kinase BaeS